MRRKSLIACMLLSVLALSAAPGCVSRLAKEGLGQARGAKGLYTPIAPLAPDDVSTPLGQYTRFELGQITDDFGGKTPPTVWALLPAEFAEQLADKKLPNDPSGKTLLIRGKVLHYESASTLGHALSPLEEIVARIELVDKDTGTVLGTANCIGRTTTSLNAGADKKAQGLAKAIVSWLDKRYPQQGRPE